MNKTFAKLGIAATVMLLAGCSTISHHIGLYPAKEGWRKGTVSEVGSGPSPSFIKNLPEECRNNQSFVQGVQRFAVVHFRYVGHPHWHATPIPEDSPLKPGDLVYINTNTCVARIEPRHLPYEKHP